MNIKQSFKFLIACLCVLIPTSSLLAQQVAVGTKWGVATGHPDATAAGISVLRNGGNVIDAAVAASLTLGVAEPYGSGLGGKLVMLYHNADKEKVTCIEALCASPLSLDPQAFGNLPSSQRRYGYHSVCVPGLPAGLFEAHERWGTKPWKELVKPAIDLSRNGVVMSEKMHTLFKPHEEQISEEPEVAKFYANDMKTPDVGSRMVNEDLAETLERLAKHGVDGFYRGFTAERIVSAAQEAGAALSLNDFKAYKPRIVKPLAINYQGYRIYSSPPPLTGGVTVLALLKAQESAEWPNLQRRDANYIHYLGKTLQCVYPKVSRVVGDSSQSTKAAKKILSKKIIDSIREDADQLHPANPYAIPVTSGSLQPESQFVSWNDQTLDDLDDASTSHLVVVDSEGNMVSLTQSLSLHFGSCKIAPGTGVLLNDSMSNFAVRLKKSVNYVGPGKRPRSTVSPTLVTRDGLPSLAIGIPGGQRIPTTTAQLLIDILDSKVPIDQAFDRPRFHLRRQSSSKLPANEIDLEVGFDQATIERLEQEGWSVTERERTGGYFGGGNAAQFTTDGKIIAVGDTRRTNFADAD